MKKKILAFGYIPKQFGGKQTTGLATGIFDLHDTVNALNANYEVTIAATDIHQNEINIAHTLIIGWNRKILLRHIIKHPIRSIYFAYKVFYLYILFYKLISFVPTLAKVVFMDYAIKKTKPDILHFHGTYGALISFSLWNKRQDIILRIHGINGFDPSIPNYFTHRKLEKFVTNLKYSLVTFVAAEIIKEWKQKYGLFNCKTISVLNGYNPKLFNPKVDNYQDKIYDLITISGISDRKGQERVVEAMIKLKKKGVNLSYLIIGSGEKKLVTKLENLKKRYNLRLDIIDYLPQKDLNKYLHRSRYFILPSITEGFGKVYVESIGSGIPVIIPKHLPLVKEENVLNGKNSFFLDDYSAESIANNLLKIISTPSTISDKEVADTVEHLQWKNIAKLYLSLYDKIFIK